MVRLSKAQRKAQAKALAAKWSGSKCRDSLAQVQGNAKLRRGVIIRVSR